ncbi:hypothetical protein LCGC14_1422570 [marine sediment metagenome]|uniref:Uncharacterized protein n=1 Tax=marine sediment metagenome TaxID=412755 RepID=A0A0F9MSP6_9ZZZZ
MNLQAIRIIKEELVKFRKGVLPNSRIIWQGGGDVETHSLLDALEAKIIERIKKECTKSLEEYIRERYPHLTDEDIPQCEITACDAAAEWEGWADKRDPLTNEKLTIARRLYVCNAHKSQLKGYVNG